MPLVSEMVTTGQTYRVRILLGGKNFRKRMENEGLLEGEQIQLQKNSSMLIRVNLVDRGTQIELGQGEAKKIIIEVISHESGE